MSDSIHVAIRIRPLIEREVRNASPVSWVSQSSDQIHQVDKRGCPVHGSSFTFDRVFPSSSTNREVYQDVGRLITESVVEGFHGTIFAYGQTSSGKTFTMMGEGENDPGVIKQAVQDIFLMQSQRPNRDFLFRVSYMEIYNEKILDLISNRSNLAIKENLEGQVFVGDLEEVLVKSVEDVLQVMDKGERNRHFGDTAMNEHSSRSHTIFKMVVESRLRGLAEDGPVKVSHLNLVDLAGSEKAGQMGTTGSRFKEGVHINKSLLTLSQVISKLSEGAFVNYRDSKLTRILQNSLGGNSRTAIICTVTPISVEQTQSTLNFAVRAKRIQNKPVVNEVLSEAAKIRMHIRQIESLQKQMREQENLIIELQKEQRFSGADPPFSACAEDSKRSSRRETWCGNLLGAPAPAPFLKPTLNVHMTDNFPEMGSASALGPIMEDEFSACRPSFEELNFEDGPTVEKVNDNRSQYVTTRRRRQAVAFVNEIIPEDTLEERTSFLNFSTDNILQESSFVFTTPKSCESRILKYSFGCQTDVIIDLPTPLVQTHVKDFSSALVQTEDKSLSNSEAQTELNICADAICQTDGRNLSSATVQTERACFASSVAQTEPRQLPSATAQTEFISTGWKESSFVFTTPKSCESRLLKYSFGCQTDVLIDLPTPLVQTHVKDFSSVLVQTEDKSLSNSEAQTELNICADAICQTDGRNLPSAMVQTERACFASSVAQTEPRQLPSATAQTEFVEIINAEAQTEPRQLPSVMIQTSFSSAELVSVLLQTSIDCTSEKPSRDETPVAHSPTPFNEELNCDKLSQAVLECRENICDKSCQTSPTPVPEPSALNSSLTVEELEEEINHWKESCEFYAKWCQERDQEIKSLKEQSAVQVMSCQKQLDEKQEESNLMINNISSLTSRVAELEAALQTRTLDNALQKNHYIAIQRSHKELEEQTSVLKEKIQFYQSKADDATNKLRRAENAKMDHTIVHVKKRESIPEDEAPSTFGQGTGVDAFPGLGCAGRIRISVLERENALIKKKYNKLLQAYRTSASSTSSTDRIDTKENIRVQDESQKSSFENLRLEGQATLATPQMTSSACSGDTRTYFVSSQPPSKMDVKSWLPENRTPVIQVAAPELAQAPTISPPAKSHVPVNDNFTLEFNRILQSRGSERYEPLDSPDGCKQQ